ncbi:MAG: Rpn family recombination-promoting nuclease/putative transposase [Clostridiales bacterium]|nr:Rpn family recombination-promoting nuclease/putative transposase [Clostridiales bacterium]
MDDNDTQVSKIPENIDLTTPLKPFADPVMEAVFANKDVAGLAARSLINAVLDDSADPIIGEITQLTPQKTMPNVLGRGYRFDIEARISNKELADIEIQNRYMNMNDRGVLYAGRFMDDNARRGEAMEKVLANIPRVIVINLLHFDLRKKHDDFHQPVDLTYRKPAQNGAIERASNKISIHNIELKKFVRHTLPHKPYTKDTPALHYWLWALCKAENENKSLGEVIKMNDALSEFAEQDAGFKQYTGRYEQISSDLQVRRVYAMWTEGMSAIDQAKAEGREEGREEGIEEGREEGINLKGVCDAVNSVIRWHCSITEAMEVVELDSEYREAVIAELQKRGVAFTL